jgi:hypothetical protein
MKLKMINLLPHPIIIVGKDKNYTIPPSGRVANVHNVIKNYCFSIQVPDEDGSFFIPIMKKDYTIYSLPEPEPGIGYIVSFICAQSITDRDDIYVIGEKVPDVKFGVKSLVFFNSKHK